jgi:mitotic spindle assembly checkpoint protein MAD1
MQEQLDHHRLCKQSLDAATQQLWEQDDGLAAARKVTSSLKGRVLELQLSAMD